MIDPIKARIEDARKLEAEVIVFTLILNTLIVFLVFAIILRMFGISAIIALCPAIIYLLLAAIFRLQKIDVIGEITKKYPSLDERLQTANDNRRISNIVVESLIKDVSARMDAMHTSSFVNSKEIASRTVIAVVLVFVFLTINFINIEDLGLDLRRYLDPDLIKQIEDYTGFKISSGMGFEPEEDEKFETKHKVEDEKIGGDVGGELPGYNEGPIPGDGGGIGLETDPNLYGEAYSAKLEGENINLEMHPEYGGDIKIKDVEEERVQDGFDGELKGKSADIPEQDPVEYREIIRKYFQSLQKIT